MKLGPFLAIVLAVLLHTGVILFGGLIFPSAKSDDQKKKVEVELVSEVVEEKKKDEPKEKPEEKVEKPPEEKPPDASEIIKNLENQPVADTTPALAELSLSAITDALNGMSASGDFANAVDFQSGGRIGGTGKAKTAAEQADSVMSLNEIDQKPRVSFQSNPVYPAELRSQKVEGVVTVLFVVEATGRVASAKVERSTNPAFEKPALDAVRQWKFEPALKGGQRVPYKMRIQIRFQPPR